MAGASNEEEITEEPMVPTSTTTVLEKETASNVDDADAQLTSVVGDGKGPLAQERKAPEGRKASRKSRSSPAPKRGTVKETFKDVASGEETAPNNTEAQVGYFVKRVGGDYLEKRKILKTQHEQVSETVLAVIMSMAFGGFLSLSGAKDNVAGECTNIGLIGALMLTIIFPLSYGNLSDWLEEDYVGSGTAFEESYLGKQLTETQLENALPWLHDVSLFFYAVGIVGFLTATTSSISMLLCVGELSTEAGCAEWLKRAGSFARAPYLMLVSGTLFVCVVILRWILAVKTLPGLIGVIFACGTGCLSVAVVCFVYVTSCIKAHNRVHEFEALHLSEKDAEEDVKKWWKWNENAKTDGTLSDCLDALAGKLTSSQSSLWPCSTKVFRSTLVIGLDGISKERVAMHYYKLRAESIGIKVSESKVELELYQLCLQQLAALPARHHDFD